MRVRFPERVRKAKGSQPKPHPHHKQKGPAAVRRKSRQCACSAPHPKIRHGFKAHHPGAARARERSATGQACGPNHHQIHHRGPCSTAKEPGTSPGPRTYRHRPLQSGPGRQAGPLIAQPQQKQNSNSAPRANASSARTRPAAARRGTEEDSRPRPAASRNGAAARAGRVRARRPPTGQPKQHRHPRQAGPSNVAAPGPARLATRKPDAHAPGLRSAGPRSEPAANPPERRAEPLEPVRRRHNTTRGKAPRGHPC